MSRSHGSSWRERFALMREIHRDQACSWWRAWLLAGVTLRDYQEYARRWDEDVDQAGAGVRRR